MRCMHCNVEHTDAHYDRVVYNKTPLFGPWAGWRMAGKDLVSPNGDRINPARLRGLLWVERTKARTLRAVKTKPMAIIPARERFAGQA